MLMGSQVGPVGRASAIPSCQIEPFALESRRWTRACAVAKTARRPADFKGTNERSPRGVQSALHRGQTEHYRAAVGFLSATSGFDFAVHGLTDPRFRSSHRPPAFTIGEAQRPSLPSSSSDTVPPPRPYELLKEKERAGDVLPRPKTRPTTLPTSCAARRADSPSPIASAPTTSSAGASRRERRGRGRGRVLRFIGSTVARRRRSRRTPRPAPLPLSRGRAGTPDAVPPEPA